MTTRTRTRTVIVQQGDARVRTTAAVDQAVEQARTRDSLDEAIDQSAATGQPIDLEHAFPDAPEGALPDPATDPRGRLAALGRGSGNHSGTYLKEYRLKMVHRLLMRNLPIDMIAQQLQVSEFTVHELRRELNKRLKAEAKVIDGYAFFGRSLAFYDEVRGMALRLATDTKVPAGQRLGALTVALASENNKHNFLDRAGFFDHNRFQPPAPETVDSVERGRSQLGMLLTVSARTLDGDEDTAYAEIGEDEGFETDADGIEVKLL